MGLIFLRTAIIFIALLAVMRLMGKRQIGEMQPFEFVITLLIAELACIPMADISIPLLYGIASIVTIFFLHQLLLLFDLKWKPFKVLVGGKPSIVINKEGIDISQLKKNHLDLSDLIESMRSAGYFSLDEVAYALYESSGQFTAMGRQKRMHDAAAAPRPDRCGKDHMFVVSQRFFRLKGQQFARRFTHGVQPRGQKAKNC